MYGNYDAYYEQRLAQLASYHQRQLEAVNRRVDELEQVNARLEQMLAEIKPLHIENVNYKVQELSVRELKGTLNIGLTALSDAEELKKWIEQAENGSLNIEDLGGEAPAGQAQEPAEDTDDRGQAHMHGGHGAIG